MSEANPREVEPLSYHGATPTAEAVARRPLTTAEWIWWGVLVVSCLIGFGMTIFAPT
ncbi:MAG: hypothetical protein H7Z14_11725 [Anaerolineae bacterium]|nr:hypothetical protein [Phycisphaerae bacterium]